MGKVVTLGEIMRLSTTAGTRLAQAEDFFCSLWRR